MSLNTDSNHLPTGWAICGLSEFVDIVMGQSPSSETYNRDGEGLPFFQGKAEFGAFYPKVDKYCSRPNKIAEKGAVLLSVRAPVGPTNLSPEKVCIGRGLAGLHPKAGIDSKFLLYLFRSIEQVLSGRGTGSTFKAISKTDIQSLKFRLPPLSEQRRILLKIEELLSEIDKGVESLKTAQEQLKVYRQAVLKQAFEGRLTAKWRNKNIDKLESPEELVQQIQSDRAEFLAGRIMAGDREAKRYVNKLKKNAPKYPESGLPKTAKWVNLLDIATIIVDCHNKTAPYQESGVTLIRTPCIKNGKIHLNHEARFVSEETYAYWSRRCPPAPGDIIFTREAPMGEVGLVPENTKLCMGQRMMLIRPPDVVNKKYLLYAMMEPGFQQRMDALSIGTGVKHLRVGDVEQMCVPLFSKPEQEEIMRVLDQHLSSIFSQEAEIEKALKYSDTLRAAILKKAFSGQLVPQDPNDEPASVLLERLRNEKRAVSE